MADTKGEYEEWTFPVNYGKEHKVSTDVLIVGSGIAGCHAAINAAKRGANVIAVDKASIKISGSGGTGCDHWHLACTNPACTVPPDEMIKIVDKYDYGVTSEWGMGPTCYVTCMESWDGLLDMEKMGGTIRDVKDEFAGAEFRDEKKKLLFAYDYDGRHAIRICGVGYKTLLYDEMKRLGVELYEHIMITSLLTEGGQQGARVVGATGFSVLTGEFYIFSAKATIVPTGDMANLWTFSLEQMGWGSAFHDPNGGDAFALAWDAGAEFTMMESSRPASSPRWNPPFGTGNAHNSWYACTLVDSNGKEVPWVDRDSNVLKTVSQRYHTVPGQKFFLFSIHYPRMPYEFRGPSMILDLGERILKGEFVPPFYADLPGMPPHERRAIWGLMVGNEGRSRYPVYLNYSLAGFDPDKDMLEVNWLPPEATMAEIPAKASLGAQERWFGFVGGFGGLVFDWDFKTSLEGLYAAGNVLAGGGNYSTSACSGRYAGRKAAAYARQVVDSAIDRSQVEKEKERVYAPVRRKNGVGWKELHIGTNKILKEYCPTYKNEHMLKAGLAWLKDIRENEAAVACARNPHELQRTLESFRLMTTAEMIMHASLARKASSRGLDFNRLDYPEIDPPDWQKYVTIKQDKGQVKVGELPLNYWLLPPNAPTYRENYEKHCDL